jgi:hypothetical protein
MRALDPRFEHFDVADVPTGAWTAETRLGGNPEARSKIQKERERSQNVIENKGCHFFEHCKFDAFCVHISAKQSLNGAKKRALCENEVRRCEL